jgi:hypothetical protein
MVNGYKGARGLRLIERYVNGEMLDEEQLQSMRAMMYLISSYIRPQRTVEDFRWSGPEHFVKEHWPEIKERQEYLNGQFGHGAIRP